LRRDLKLARLCLPRPSNTAFKHGNHFARDAATRHIGIEHGYQISALLTKVIEQAIEFVRVDDAAKPALGLHLDRLVFPPFHDIPSLCVASVQDEIHGEAGAKEFIVTEK
jgi:hypothetical protein